jgi:hypothetical protein
MAGGREIWESAAKLPDANGVRSANAMRFYALSKMLAEAEMAMLKGQDKDCAERLRELQAHCEKMLGILAPNAAKAPTLVAA